MLVPALEPTFQVRLGTLEAIVNTGGVTLNVAVTLLALDTVTLQVVPELVVHPVQLINDDNAVGTAVRVTIEPAA